MPYAKYHYPNTSLSHAALALTSDLLRHDNPSLAGAVRSALVSIRELPPKGRPTDHWPLNAALVASLEAQTVGKILAALTDLGNRATDDWSPDRLRLLQELLKDWVELAEWLLRCADTSQTEAFH